MEEKIEEIYKICKNLEFYCNVNQLKKELYEAKKFHFLYEDLEDSTKEALKNIFPSSDNDVVLVKGVTKILSIWDYLEYLLIEGRSKEFKKLKKLFDELFKTYSKISNVKKQQVNLKYDDEFYTKTPSSPAVGNITQILLDGLVKDGKIIKKAVVKVEK